MMTLSTFGTFVELSNACVVDYSNVFPQHGIIINVCQVHTKLKPNNNYH